MSWITCNIRGLLRQHSVQVLILLEPMVASNPLSRVAYKLGFPNFFDGGEDNHQFWILWHSTVKIIPLHVMRQAITVKVIQNNTPDVVASFIYVNCLARLRVELWDHLLSLVSSISSPWIISGDFNIISNLSEKNGGLMSDSSGMYDFQNFIMQAALIDPGFIG